MLSFAVASIAFAAAVSAQTVGYHAINLPGLNEVVPACEPYTIRWTPSPGYSGAVTFQLIGGATQLTLVDIGGKFGNIDGSAGSYVWDVPCGAGSEPIYGLKILQVADLDVFQFSTPFQIQAAAPVSTNSVNTLNITTTTAATTMTAPEPTGVANTTSVANGTVIAHTPTQPVTTVTSVATTDPATTTMPTAGASQIMTGSFAALAVFAAFLAW